MAFNILQCGFKRVQQWTGMVLLVTLLACLASMSAWAQGTTGSFSGQVVDQSGAVIPQASLTLINESTRDVRKTVSNEVGLFTFAAVSPGSYTVSVEMKGFKSFKKTGMVLTAGDSIKIPNIALEIGSSEESIEISASEQPLVPTDNGVRSMTISEVDMQRLSTQSRDASELLKILPGVSSVGTGTGNTQGFDLSNAGATGSTIGNGLSANGAPYRGGSAYLLDGANIIDPGCNCYSIASVNPDMAQEVKIQTSNFGADSANGPMIVSTISKSGGAQYHGSAYLYARNSSLNSNDWISNYFGSKKTDTHYYYPGGNIGGPIPLSLTDRSKVSKNVFFWFGYESMRQQLPGTTLQSTIPTAGMMAGDFTTNGAGNSAVCTSGFSSKNTDWCNDLTGAYAPDGTPITGSNIAAYIDPGAKALATLWPSANADPTTHGGYNYYTQVSAPHNGQIWRARVDYNLNTNNKLYVAYQEGTDTSSTASHIWWTPDYSVPYAGGNIVSKTTSRVLTFNLLNIITPTLTNEFIFAWGYSNSPMKPSHLSSAYSTSVGFPYGTVYNGSLLAPSISGTKGLPDTSQPDIWAAGNGSYPLKKATPSFTDNVTKTWKQHTFKAGGFTQLVSNNQGNFVNYNGQYTFDNSIQADAVTNTVIGSGNPTANFLMGIAKQFTQTDSEPLGDQAYRTTAFYVMDDWKMARRLTVNLGVRMEHIGRWYDRRGVGNAVWLPDLYASDVADNPSWAFPGVRWHGVDPGIPNSGAPTRTAYTSPRLGMAWDIFGTGKTVLRGGWGMYRWNDQSGDYGGPQSTAQKMGTYTSPSGRSITMSEVSKIGAAGNVSASSGLSGVADPTDYDISTTDAFNATISQQTPWRTMLEVAYVGNSTSHLLMGGQSNGSGVAAGFVNQNKIPTGGIFKADPVTGAAAPTDPDDTSSYNLTDYYPYYKGYGTSAINMNTHVGYGNYNALQVTWAKPAGNLTYNINYTWQKSLGILSNTVDAFSVHGNYGVLGTDRPQVINASYAYTLAKPFSGGNKLVSGALNGWTISGTTTWQAGPNIQAVTSQNLGMKINNTTTGKTLSTKTWFGTDTGEILPTQLCDVKSHLSSHQYMNASCFGVPAVGSQGVRQFSYLGGPSYYNTDLTIYKTFHITERQAVDFRVAAFNVFNHPLWAFNGSQYTTLTYETGDASTFTNTSASNLSSSTPDWGRAYYKNGQRIMEMSVKYHF